MNFSLKFIILVFITSLSACTTEDSMQIDGMIKDKTVISKYIVQGQVTDRSSKHFVSIVTPVGIGESIENSGVTGADVVVSDGNRVFIYDEIPEGDVFYTNRKVKSGVYVSQDYFRGESGRTYTLNITIGEKVYSAFEKMPKPEELRASERQLLSTSRISRFFGQERTTIFLEDNDKKDDCRWYLEGDVALFKRLRPESFYAASYSLTKEPYLFYISTNSVISRLTFSEGYKNFLWSFWSQTKCSIDTPYSTEPGNVESNFNSPEIGGYFAAISRRCYVTPSCEEYPISVYKTQKVFTTEYKDRGTFKITFEPTGQCILEGLGKQIRGAYDIRNLSFKRDLISLNTSNINTFLRKNGSVDEYNDKSIVIYFSPSLKTKYPELYGFYKTQVAMIGVSYMAVPKIEMNYGDLASFIDLSEGHITSFNEQRWIAE